MLVNDEPITALEVEQRARLNALSANVGERASANMKALVQSESTQKRFRAMVEQIVKENQQPKSARADHGDDRAAQDASSPSSCSRQAVASARSSVLPGIRKTALEELIDERLKLQEAKRLTSIVEDARSTT